MAPLTYNQEVALRIASLVCDPFRRLVPAFRLIGPWDIELIRSCLEVMIERHASLRTRFTFVNGSIEQQVDEPSALILQTTKIQARNREDIEDEAKHRVQDFIEHRVDLSVGPLFDVRLFALGDAEHLLVFRMDHLVADAASCAILVREMLIRYLRGLGRPPVPLAPAMPSMVDIALSQRLRHASWIKEHEPYWRERFADSPRIQFPADEPVEVPSPGLSETPIQLGPELTRQLRELGRRLGTPLAMVLLAVYVALLSRCCERSDLVVCLVVRGRNRAEHQGIFGSFAYRLFLRMQLHANDRFVQLAERVTREVSTALLHDDQGQFPLLQPDVSYLGSFNWQSFAGRVELPASASLPGAILESFPCRVTIPSLDALRQMNERLPESLAWRHMLFVNERPDSISGTIGFPAIGVTPATLDRFVRSLLGWCRRVCEDPQCRVSTAVEN